MKPPVPRVVPPRTGCPSAGGGGGPAAPPPSSLLFSPPSTGQRGGRCEAGTAQGGSLKRPPAGYPPGMEPVPVASLLSHDTTSCPLLADPTLTGHPIPGPRPSLSIHPPRAG